MAHVLKKHVSMDRVPYSCGLCNFRCTERVDLVKHLTQYKRHVEETRRPGVIIDYNTMLQRSENPVDLDLYMEDLDVSHTSLIDEALVTEDQSLFETPEGDEPLLPDWLSDVLADGIMDPLPRPNMVTEQSNLGQFRSNTVERSHMLPAKPTRQGLFQVPSNFYQAPRALPSNNLGTPILTAVPISAPSQPVVVATRTPHVTELPPPPGARPAGSSGLLPGLQEPKKQALSHQAGNLPLHFTPGMARATAVPVSAQNSFTNLPLESAIPQTLLFSTPLLDEPVYGLPTVDPTGILTPLVHQKDDLENPVVRDDNLHVNSKADDTAKLEKTENKGQKRTAEGELIERDAQRQSTIAIVNAITKGNGEIANLMREQSRDMRQHTRTLETLVDEVRRVRQGIDILVRNSRAPRTLTPSRTSPKAGQKSIKKKIS